MIDDRLKEDLHWKEGQTLFPNDFGDDIRNGTHFQILFKMMTFNHSEEKTFSQRYVSQITGWERSTVGKALEVLEDLGYVSKNNYPGHALPTYFLTKRERK